MGARRRRARSFGGRSVQRISAESVTSGPHVCSPPSCTGDSLARSVPAPMRHPGGSRGPSSGGSGRCGGSSFSWYAFSLRLRSSAFVPPSLHLSCRLGLRGQRDPVLPRLGVHPGVPPSLLNGLAGGLARKDVLSSLRPKLHEGRPSRHPPCPLFRMRLDHPSCPGVSDKHEAPLGVFPSVWLLRSVPRALTAVVVTLTGLLGYFTHNASCWHRLHKHVLGPSPSPAVYVHAS